MKIKPVRQVIKCPHCGWEYLPGEIYYPGAFLGKPDSVIRDALGKIIYEDYEENEEPNLEEHYECDNCGKSFVVNATISYKSGEEKEELDFSNQFASLLD
jgi:predicted RNA-binding Zn-ribbon protein involved in translation (DUF1610 family)